MIKFRLKNDPIHDLDAPWDENDGAVSAEEFSKTISESSHLGSISWQSSSNNSIDNANKAIDFMLESIAAHHHHFKAERYWLCTSLTVASKLLFSSCYKQVDNVRVNLKQPVLFGSFAGMLDLYCFDQMERNQIVIGFGDNLNSSSEYIVYRIYGF